MTEKRLRISHVLVQPVVVWDDGDNLEPGPEVDALAVPYGQLAEFVTNLPEQVAALADRFGANQSQGVLL